MKLQTSTLLAVCSLLEFAADPQRQFSTGEVAGKYGASAHHLAKVLGRLRRAGLVTAARGSGGGYRFSGNAKRVTLLEVIELFERIGSPSVRSTKRKNSVETSLDLILTEIDENARATFGSITLETLLKLARPRP